MSASGSIPEPLPLESRSAAGLGVGSVRTWRGLHVAGRYHRSSSGGVPPQSRQLYVCVWYERAVWMMAQPQFARWHGKPADEIGIWDGRARSNVLLIGAAGK